MRKNEHNTDLNIIGFVRDVWAAKIYLLGGLLLSFLAAFLFVGISFEKFEARMMIGPAQPLDAPTQARFQDGQNSYVLGGETSVSHEVVSNFVRFEAMMRGSSVAKLLLRDNRIVDGLKRDRGFVFEDERAAFQPSELSHYIGSRVKFDRFGETPLKEMVYRHSDREFAAYFLQQVHRVSDQLIRAELRGQIDERISYLERLVAMTANPDQRRVMTNLLLEQERARMMVSMDAPVAASVIEPAVSGVNPVWPDRGLVFSVFGVLGLMLGYLLHGLVHYKEDEAEQSGVVRGEDLQHKPRRPLKYGSWFQNVPDNDVEAEPKLNPKKRDASHAAE